MSLSKIWIRPRSAFVSSSQKSPNWEDQLISGRVAALKDWGELEEGASRDLMIQGGDYPPQLSTH